MTSKRHFNFCRLFILLAVYLLCQCFSLTQVLADATLSTIKDLPSLGDEAQENSQEVKSSNRRIIILYDKQADNNLGKLKLKKSEFSAGESVSKSLDVLEVNAKANPKALIKEIASKEGVAAVDLEGETGAAAVNDVLVGEQYYLSQIGADRILNSFDKDSQEVKVAVLDTGVNAEHEDLLTRVDTTGRDMIYNTTSTADLNGHGTEVSGIIAAQVNNQAGIAGASGTAPVKIVPYRVLGANSRGKLSTVAAAIEDAASREDIRIIHMSLGFQQTNSVLDVAIRDAVEAGKIIIASTGNSNEGMAEYPALYPDVIGVGSVTSQNVRCSPLDWGEGQGSNFGNGLEVCAPGTGIITCSGDAGNAYVKVSGTSFSAAMVTAACAACLSKNSTLTPLQMREIIKAGAQDINYQGFDDETGYGVLRVDRMLAITPSVENGKAVARSNSDDLSFDKTSVDLCQEDSFTLKLNNVKKQSIVWSTSNPAVATVDKNGKVTAHQVGAAIIQCQPADGSSLGASCLVTVIPELSYNSYISEEGWNSVVTAPTVSGSPGLGLPMEAICVNAIGHNLGVETSVDIADFGWTDYKPAGTKVGKAGQGYPIEAVRFRLTGEKAADYDLCYRVYVTGYGWTQWAFTSQPAGTDGFNIPIEGYQILLVKKGSIVSEEGSDLNWAYAR